MDKRLLLTSIFKPCGVDDAYGRKENKAELMHNQLSMHQGIFSPRDRSASISLHILAQNLDHPVTVLDWPTLRRYEEEIRKGYDYIGISFIQPNFVKAKKMVDLAREISPRSRIILGGFGAEIDDIEAITGADFVCRGEGIGFLRKLLGEPEAFEFRHPLLPTTEFLGVMGIPVRFLQAALRPFFPRLKWRNRRAVIVTGVGCAEGCDFCSSGHFFQPRRIVFIDRGEEIFRLMKTYDETYGIRSFLLVGDENVFSDRRRMEELHRALRENGKYYGIHISFSSLNHLAQYDPKFLAEVGLEVVWVGIESKFRPYPKNEGLDIPGLLAEYRRYGIVTVISSILCLDEHNRENIREDIDYHLSLNPVYSQFAHYSPSPGTPLWQRMKAEGRILNSIPLEDRHAFKQIWFKHPHFTPRESEIIQREAYLRDFHELGPSIVRLIRVNFEAYPTLLNSGSELLRQRAGLIRSEAGISRILLRAAELLAPTEKMSRDVRELRRAIERDFGKTSVFEHLAAAAIYPFGKGQEFRTRHWGDAIQPRTVLTEFDGKTLGWPGKKAGDLDARKG
ncbi:MAG: cobalamin-dependent protein [bacterium]|nr:cobalamin-dependent protein [bacterium]